MKRVNVTYDVSSSVNQVQAYERRVLLVGHTYANTPTRWTPALPGFCGLVKLECALANHMGCRAAEDWATERTVTEMAELPEITKISTRPGMSVL